MRMSARLIKNDSIPPDLAFVPFSFPEHDVLELEAINPATPVAAVTPDVEAERIILAAQAHAAQIEQEMYAKMQDLVQAGVAAEVARVVNPWQELLQQGI